MHYDVLLLSLALDLAAMSLLTYGIYFHRHHRRDLTLGFMGVNIGLFAVATFVSTKPIGLAFGIGLFALLSVIRLRSTQVSQEEIGYYFVAIVVGLVSGLSPDAHWAATITLVVVLIGVMYVADHPRLLRGYQRRIVRLKHVYDDDELLRAALEAKLGGKVVHVEVLETDFVQKQTRADVRFRPFPPGTRPARPHREAAPRAHRTPTPEPADRVAVVAAPPPGPDGQAATPAAPVAPLDPDPTGAPGLPGRVGPPWTPEAPVDERPDEMRLDADERSEEP